MRCTISIITSAWADDSYGLVFTPCPIWVQGRRLICTAGRPGERAYRPGGVARLIARAGLAPALAAGPRRCVVLVHADGAGSAADVRALCADLRANGFVADVLEASLPKTCRGVLVGHQAVAGGLV